MAVEYGGEGNSPRNRVPSHLAGRPLYVMEKQPPIQSVVFVIDDDASVRSSLKSLFKSVGLDVRLFGSADVSCRTTVQTSPAAWCSTSGCQG